MSNRELDSPTLAKKYKRDKLPVLEILPHALRVSLRAFLLGYSLRSGFTLLLKLFAVIRRKLDFKTALISSLFGSDSLRFGSFFSIYCFLWKAIDSSLHNIRDKDDKLNGFIGILASKLAGSVAGIALLCEKKDRRVTIAQQVLVRGLQGGYNFLKSRNLFTFPHGDSLLFILSSAQILYGYALQPASLPRSYYQFMVKTAQIPEPILAANRSVVRGVPIIVENMIEYGEKYKASVTSMVAISNMTSNPIAMPCALLHASNDSCTRNTIQVFKKVFLQILPVYMSLNFAPMLALRFKKFIKSPVAMTKKSFTNACRSSVFLGVFVSLYQAMTCVHRNVILYTPIKFESKFLYYIYGLICSTSIFIEHKNRRSELALYVFPKSVESLYHVLYQRKWMIRVPYFEVGMFSVGMGLLIGFFQTEPQIISNFVFRLFWRINNWIEDTNYKRLLPVIPQDKEVEIKERRSSKEEAVKD